MESFGFSQTTDSAIQGTFTDMIFVNPVTNPGKKFLIEAKAEIVKLKSKKLARELVKYFRMSQNSGLKDTLFKLFAQGVDKPTEWESFFSEKNNFEKVREWCQWYNNKVLEPDESPLDEGAINQIYEFFARSEVIVGSVVDLQLAAIESQSVSALSITKMATNLCKLVYRRKTPLPTKSKMVMNILPVLVPNEYYSCKSVVDDKKEIYRGLEGEVIPPFLFTRNKEILTFAEFDADNSLCKYIVGSVTKFSMKELQEKNPTFSSSLVNIHMRRMFWNKSLYRDPRADVLYFPMLNKTLDRLEMIDHRGVKRWVVKKILHKKDTKYHKVGEINFYFHRGVEVKTPTYWGESFVELIPRRYYTLDGEKWIEGEIRAKIDRKFRKPQFDRSKTRLGLMRFWKHILFDSEFVIPPEKWFSKFKFGNFVTENVNWSPRVIGRTQMRLWDYRSD